MDRQRFIELSTLYILGTIDDRDRQDLLAVCRNADEEYRTILTDLQHRVMALQTGRPISETDPSSRRTPLPIMESSTNRRPGWFERSALKLGFGNPTWGFAIMLFFLLMLTMHTISVVFYNQRLSRAYERIDALEHTMQNH